MVTRAQLVHASIQSLYSPFLFRIASCPQPPPPPLEPQGAACQEYYPTAYAELGEPGVMDPEMGMAVIAADFLSTRHAPAHHSLHTP